MYTEIDENDKEIIEKEAKRHESYTRFFRPHLNTLRAKKTRIGIHESDENSKEIIKKKGKDAHSFTRFFAPASKSYAQKILHIGILGNL